MFTRKVAVRLLIPAATLVAEKTELKCRPSELPIYAPEPQKEPTKMVREPGTLEKRVGNIRKEIMALNKYVHDLENTISDTYEDSKKQVQWLIDYLQKEDNTTPRAGAIAIGGLAGLILGLRGGFFRRLLFTTTGALGMAAICYPNEAVEYSEIASKEAKRYLSIAYNFYYGVKKDDPPLELPSLPKIPSPSELWALVANSKSKNNIVLETEQETEVKQNDPKVQPVTKQV